MRSGAYHRLRGHVIRIGAFFIENGFDSRVQHHYGDRTAEAGRRARLPSPSRQFKRLSTVAKPELGIKRVCPETGRKFYDLNKDPIVSPYTGKEYPISYFEETAKVAIIEKVKEEEEEVAEVDGESTDVEIVSLEEADEDTASTGKSDDLPDIDDDVEIDDDDDDTFLADDDDDDDDDVSDIIGVNDDDDDQ